jgi:hypothetical protein
MITITKPLRISIDGKRELSGEVVIDFTILKNPKINFKSFKCSFYIRMPGVGKDEEYLLITLYIPICIQAFHPVEGHQRERINTDRIVNS